VRPTLTALTSKFGQICAVSMSVSSANSPIIEEEGRSWCWDVVLGDLLKSVAWLKFKAVGEGGSDACVLENVAFDVQAHWMQAVCCVLSPASKKPPRHNDDDHDNNGSDNLHRQVALGSDTGGNLFLYGTCRDPFMASLSSHSPAKERTPLILRPVSAMFLGSPIVTIIPSSPTSHPSSSATSHNNNGKDKSEALTLVGEDGRVWRGRRVRNPEHVATLRRVAHWLGAHLPAARQHQANRQWRPGPDTGILQASANRSGPVIGDQEGDWVGNLLLDGDALLAFFDDLTMAQRMQCARDLGIDSSVLLEAFLKSYLLRHVL
jgi:hypothetical protein